MCSLFLFAEDFVGLLSPVVNEPDKTTKYLAQTPTRLEDETT